MNEIQNGQVWNRMITMERGASGTAMFKNKKPQCPINTRQSKVHFYSEGKRVIKFWPTSELHRSENKTDGIDLINWNSTTLTPSLAIILKSVVMAVRPIALMFIARIASQVLSLGFEVYSGESEICVVFVSSKVSSSWLDFGLIEVTSINKFSN